MNSDTNKSSRELKNEVIDDLKKLNRDIDRLKERLTPGQIIDDALMFRSARTPRATFDHLKANPLGTSFLALGTLLLMEDERHRSFEALARERSVRGIDSARGAFSDAKLRVGEKVDELKAGVKAKLPKKGASEEKNFDLGRDIGSSQEFGSEFGTSGASPGLGVSSSGSFTSAESERGQRIDELKSKTSEGIDQLKSKTSGKVEDVKARASSAAASAKEQFHGLAEEVKHRTGHGIEAAKEKVGPALESVKDSLAQSKDRMKGVGPLSYVVLGAGLGALTGTSLPLGEEGSFSAGPEQVSNFSRELKEALNESANILKNGIIDEFTHIDLKIFGEKSEGKYL